QASFTALNIVPDDQDEDEVDNTKEIQIEEALKLYQVALKIHSQGPQFYEKAAVAYQELLKSEIFRYPESETEFQRVNNYPELEYVDATIALEVAAARADGAPSTLPQILYLSHKNHGIFILDCVRSLLRYSKITRQELGYQGIAAVENFSLALASDASDTDLWRRTARVCEILGSRRISRYCLEAALEVDDDPTVAEVEPASIEEGFAGVQLKELLEVLSDNTALSHPIMTPFLRRSMPDYLLKYMDQYPYLSDETKLLKKKDGESPTINTRTILNIPERSWSVLGENLCKNLLSTFRSTIPGVAISLQIPPETSETRNNDMALSYEKTKDLTTQDTEMTDISGLNNGQINELAEDGSLEAIATLNSASCTDDLTSPIISLPSRKRSQSTAGIRESKDDENTHKRSKRIRNRDNLNDEPVDPTTQYAEQLEKYVQNDEVVFCFVGGLLGRLKINDLGTISDLQTALSLTKPIEPQEIITNTAVRDLREILRTWDEAKASKFINENKADILGSSTGSENVGLANFLNQREAGNIKVSNFPAFDLDKGLCEFVMRVNSEWMPLKDTIVEWVLAVIPTYLNTTWQENLKLSVISLISHADAEIFTRFQHDAEKFCANEESLAQLVESTQTLFELHLNVHAHITGPDSIVPYSTRYMSYDRLTRWAFFSRRIVGEWISDSTCELSLRYLWACAYYATTSEDVTREHKVCCWSDLEAFLKKAGNPYIELPNNAVMPEISADAANREASKLTTIDFFFNLFQADKSDPVAIIETLEPVLDPDSAIQQQTDEKAAESASSCPTALKEMWKFLKSGSTSLRLYLWQRLRDAYLSIGYKTKVFSCYLKSIEIIVEDLRSDEYINSVRDARQHKLLTWLKVLDDLLVKSLTIALNDHPSCFEIIDERHLKSTCTMIAQLSRILHAAAIFDDEVRVKMIQLPTTATYSERGSFNGFINKLREMQVRTWALQYAMLKEAMSQYRELFPQPDTELADYLTNVHRILGLRKFCKVSNKIFLKMTKVELIRLKHIENWEDYLGQVLYDLYGIKLGMGKCELEDHGCPTEPLDKKTVLNISDRIIALANTLSMKDLLKHELRQIIERMQASLGHVKSSTQMQHNLRTYNQFIKKSIRPLEMHQAWNGQLQINCLPVTNLDNSLGKKGWYFLQGMISLTKYRSIKRLAPGPQSDDIRAAANFMRLQIQYNPDDWEAWYRQAQCFDLELEEEVLWNTDKINNHKSDLVKIQRNSIHCYSMALSTAYRTVDLSFTATEKLSEMYHDFGMRLYASSREPFHMEAFYVDDFEKHMSGTSGMYKRPLHAEMTKYRVWKYAARLFKASLRDRPDLWTNHYMLAKCLWKMFYRFSEEQDSKVKEHNPPTVEGIVKACLEAIKTVPKPTKSSVEPIIEPHYKFVSIIHKLVSMKAMSPQAGADLIQQQPYAARKGQPIMIENVDEDWGSYIIEQVRHLRKEDKQHWQHRMIARVASMLYIDGCPTSDHVNAIAAKNEFRESMFTKTMHIQVWKPETERPGRHCVYMERYTRWMVRLLELTNDKPNLEALVKRVRKKGHEFYRFSQVWTEACIAYLRLIRRTGSIPSSVDDLFKSVPADEFEMFSDRLTTWIADPLMQHPSLEALRETSELKKVNANLMKPAPIDDLINDAWAVLYTEIAKDLPVPDEQSTSTSQTGCLGHPKDGSDAKTQLSTSLNSEPIKEKPRKIGVPRREVLRRAESAVSRTVEVTRSTALTTGGKSSASSIILYLNVGIENTKDKSGASTPLETSISQNEGREEVDERGAEINMYTKNTIEGEDDGESERGSLHDSADDESDLSDVPGMDEVESAPLFPNLPRKEMSG
ncbi:BgTH12-03915, partial [Blumeria graminis f. sp. triticale]